MALCWVEDDSNFLYVLQDLFVGVPLITTTNELNLEPARASNQETIDFIEGDLRAAAANLPVNTELSGKATKGEALALLGRVMLNTKQWENAAEAMREVIALNKNQLFTPIEGLFSVENEGN